MPQADRHDPFANFNFRVEIDNIAEAGFSEVLLPSSAVDVFEYREGGEASCSVRRLPGRVHFGNLVLRRGVTESNALFEWWLTVCRGRADRRNVLVVLLDGSGNVVKRWAFLEALPVRYSLDPLDARGAAPVIESLELAFEQMSVEN
jgi:phage tail-like protein